MSMIVNTNVSSLTAQRSLAESSRMLDTAMERLATGSKINSASDDAAGLAIVQRMTSQIQGLGMAVKNANDGISMTQSIEGALVEVTDMLQRLRELSIQAANATNTDADRAFIQEEVNLLIAEISRISANTRYNGQKVLDGSYTNVQLQVGTEGGETITFNVDSSASDALGAYKVTGDRIEASVGTGAGALTSPVGNGDDIIINGNKISKTIDVVADDSAKAVATKVNAVAGETSVAAEAKTYAHLYSEYATDQTYSVRVNNVTTGTFAISSSNVSDAVEKINAISGSTGVQAEATTDNKVRLYAADGRDISVENESTGTALRVQSVGFDGVSTIPQKNFLGGLANVSGAADGILIGDVACTLVQRSTGNTYAFTLGNGNARTAANIETVINAVSGLSGFKVSDNAGTLRAAPVITATEDFGDFDIYEGTDINDATKLRTDVGEVTKMTWDTDHGNLDGNGSAGSVTYELQNLSTGKNYAFTVTSTAGNGQATAAQVVAGLDAIDGVGTFKAVATASDAVIYGPQGFGSWQVATSAGVVIAEAAITHAGDLNVLDQTLAAGGGNDTATVQGTIELTSSKSFSVTQSDEAATAVTDPAVATGSLLNDNYFVTRAATLDSVSNVNLRTTAGAGAAIKTLDGAIEKISSARAELGAIENRLMHTVSNLMNVAENTAHSRSQINDTDFSVESANLAKAQVLQQAGTAMLAQANARSQLVLQLLQ
jgi:flagellin